ncbi:putative ribonuclease H-like domain-containing protein [Tanacetum coccineum]
MTPSSGETDIRSLQICPTETIKTGRVNVNTGKQNVSSGSKHVNDGSVHFNSGTQFKSGASRFNTGKQNVNSGRVHVNTARVNRPVLSNQTSQVNLRSPKKCISKQSSPVNRPFSRNTTYKSNIYALKGKIGSAVKTSAGCVWRKTTPHSNTNSGPTPDSNVHDHPLKHMEHRGIFDSGCSGHMTGNRAHLEDYQELNKVGSVTFGGSKGSISGKGTIRLGNLVFDDVAFVKELGHFNLFSISQICDKKLNVLFTEKECFVVSSDFKMPDENQVLLKVPRQHNMYTFDMKTVDSSKGYTCLLAKASSNEAKLWHRRLGHLNFKNLNKLVKDNLVRGLPSKSFRNDHTCVACQKGKQHKASCKAKIDRYVTHPLHTLHMDLFGPTSVRSINHASYCLVITDDYSRFCWVFFLAKKDETSDILKTFIRQIENQLNHKVKIIRSDNGTEFKNRVMLEFCGKKGIKQEFSNARTPQQNGVAERMNRTLIEAARTMLADSLLPTTFWAEAVNTACYTFNRVRVTKPQNKTPYELLFGHKPILSYIKPFGCHVTILNTLSPLGKFDGKSDEGFLVGYSVNSKAFRVYNLVTKRVEVNLHVNFLEEKPNVQGLGHRWMFDLDYLTDSMNYIPVSLQNQANPAGSKEVNDIDVQTEEAEELLVVSSTSRTAAGSEHNATKKSHSSKKPSSTPISKSADDIMVFRKELDALALKHLGPVPTKTPTSTNPVNTGSGNLNTGNEQVSPGHIEAVSPSAHNVEEVFSDDDDDEMPEMRIYDKSSEGLMLSDLHTSNNQRSNHKDQHIVFFACFLSQFEPRKVSEALEDGSWVEAMQEELLQFKLQQVWVLVDLPNGAKNRAISLFLALPYLWESIVNQMDIKMLFYMALMMKSLSPLQPPGFVDPDHPTKVYNVVKSFVWIVTNPLELEAAITPRETSYHLTKDDESCLNVEYTCDRSMKSFPMYLTASRPDIMYAVCVCSRFQKFTTGDVNFLSKTYLNGNEETTNIATLQQLEAEYVAAANCCDKFCETKHIEIRQQATSFREWLEKKLHKCEKIHTELKCTELVDQTFDGTPVQYFVLALINFGQEKDMPVGHFANWDCKLVVSNDVVGIFLQKSKLRWTQQLNATIDSIEYTITEESVRRQLKLADASGINMLQNEEIFAGLQNIGVESLEKELSDTKQTLGTAILQLIEKVKKLENKLRQKRKREETEDKEDAEGQDQEVPSQTDQGMNLLLPCKRQRFREAQADQIKGNQIYTNSDQNTHIEEPAETQKRVQRRKGKDPMTEEDLQAEDQASKKSNSFKKS